LILVLVMLMLPKTVKAVDTAEFKVGIASGEKDDTVEVTVSLENDSNFVAGNYELDFDSTKLEYVSYTNGQILNEAGMSIVSDNDVSNGKVIIAYTANPTEKSHDREKGSLITVKFKIITDTLGKTDLTFSCSTLKQEDGTDVPVNVTNGYVDVIKKVKSVSLNKDTLSLEKGDTETLVATYSPTDTTEDTTITWSSSNEKVATVNSTGTVTAVGGGQAKIKAQIGSCSAECTVNVTVALTDITLNKDKVDLVKGQSEKITVAYVPTDTTDSKTITWASSDEKIAKVESDGTITGVGEGKTTITATCGSISKTVTVTVTEIPLESISIDKKNLELNPGDTDTLTVLFNPENTTDPTKPITWTSSNESIVKVNSDGTITAVGEGKVTITAKVGDKSTTIDVTVKAKENATNNTNTSATNTTGTTSTSTGTLPKTGDIKIGLYVVLLVCGIIGIIYIIRKRK
jgi:LPXTG-motif cell wall-anchored protein